MCGFSVVLQSNPARSGLEGSPTVFNRADIEVTGQKPAAFKGRSKGVCLQGKGA